MTSPLASVVIPAHDEQAVLGRCLDTLLEMTAPGELDVVVVANACRDRTAEVARAAGVRVIETPTPGKANALRLGDAACLTFPRVYLDADVELAGTAVKMLVKAMDEAEVLACAPVPSWNLDRVGRGARRVHRVQDRLVAPERALDGVGVYVLSERGHARAFPLPEVISDDGWVHRQFAPDERLVVTRAQCVIRPARTVRAELRRRVRVRQGNRQLAALGLPPAQGRIRLRALAALLTERSVSPLDAACYLFVLGLDRLLTSWRGVTGGRAVWATDTGSRTG
jgi:glycosyltransferase involved in cell wall biosynthesis